MRRLPLDGLAWGSMSQVVARGSTVVALGTGAVKDGDPAQLVVWRSADGGRTWHHQLLAAELQTDIVTLVALSSGFGVIASRVDETTRPVLLLSDDGTSWRDHPVDTVPQQPGEGAQVVDAVPDGDDLQLLVRTTNRLGAGTRVVVQPTR